jgi:pimeloyl-ACP methyl ester carboxylesterase
VWEAVIHGLGDTPALTYDRPGIAGSSYDGRSPTPERVNEHLRALLDRLEMAPPYILVGHSWGGALILNYVDQFPEEVSGVVYVDPSILIPKVADTRGILRGLGASDPEITTYERQETEEFEKAIEALSQAPPGLRAEILAMDEYRRSQAADAPRSLPSLPSSVILAGRPEPGVGPGPGMLPQSISWPALFDANRAFNQAQFTERLSHIAGTSVLVSEDAGHAIHRDTPAIVVQEIRRVVALTLRR